MNYHITQKAAAGVPVSGFFAWIGQKGEKKFSKIFRTNFVQNGEIKEVGKWQKNGAVKKSAVGKHAKRMLSEISRRSGA